MNEIKRWMYAKSLSGHDQNRVYMIYAADGEYLYLTDGRIRTLQNLKKKKIKHVQIDYSMAAMLQRMDEEGRAIRDEDIRKALKEKAGNTK